MSSDTYANSRDKVSRECEYENWSKPKKPRIKNALQPQSSGDAAGSRSTRLSALCVALLCVLLLSVIIVLSVKLNNVTRERDRLQSHYDNVTTERDGFQKTLNNYKEHCQRYFITTVKKTWNESRQECRSRGADLATITTREEQEHINKRFKGTEAWIGLTDIDEENKWKWLDGTALNTGFWWKGEPNNYDHNEDCVVTGSKFSKDEFFTWADYPCYLGVLAICDRSANK